MSFFQKTILKKYVHQLNIEKVDAAYVRFKAYFYNTTIQENIRQSKEEQFQEGFLRELFGNILGYTLNPNPDYNLTTELKNTSNSKKADGAILIDSKAVAVIELKGTETTDLTKIETQAFSYKNNQPHCSYVITSNFEKLRFYIDNTIDFLEFNLFKLNRDEFNLLWLCLSYESILQHIPKKIKEESVNQEDIVTKKLYNDYSVFKRELYQNLVKLNPDYQPLQLFKISQKLLDRFLFIFFAEDRLLLPTNLIYRINKEWQQLREMRIEVSLYDRYKIYFHDLNVGAKVSLPAFSQTASTTKEEFQIYAYNGGLFNEDEVLNAVKIDDDILFKHTENISKYDFQSEVDVNILGHIFENSLNELDEIKAQLEGKAIDKSKTKRKKDGVFYTPKYITKYIVENTVGKLCDDKKEELQLIEEQYVNDKKKNQKTKKDLLEKLNNYRNWLLQLTICDPACGSGAFLNQALDFLITEHRYIDELQAKLFGDTLVLSDVEGSILENNLFGVDINEESVEIARLSLWLRTAKPNRKLNDLSNNIKCGNSLIDDPAIAGDKAFNWQKEFPQVFGEYVEVDKKNTPKTKVKKKNSSTSTIDETTDENQDETEGHFTEKQPITNTNYQITNDDDRITNVGEPLVEYQKHNKGGFDVVIGNPPYGVNFNAIEKKYLAEIDSTVPDYEIYIYFISLYKKILKQNSVLSYIFPNTFLSTIFGKTYREILFKNVQVYQIVDLSSDKTFSDASVRTCILTFKNSAKSVDTLLVKIENQEFINIESISKKAILKETENILSLFHQNRNEKDIFRKLQSKEKLKNYFEVSQGYIPYRKSDLIKKYGNDEGTKIVEQRLWHSSIKLSEDWENEIQGKNVFHYYYTNSNSYVKYGKHVASYVEKKFFNQTRVLIREITSSKLFCALIDEIAVNNPSLINIINEKKILDLKYILPLLNSNLVGWLHNKTSPKANKGLFPKILINDVRHIPIVNISASKQQPFIHKADIMIDLNKELHGLSQKFQNTIKHKFELQELPKKLENWYLLSFSEFEKELNKKKVKIPVADTAEWNEYFNTESKKVLTIKNQIDSTDKEIDLMVYKLYELTFDEVKIVDPTFVLSQEEYNTFTI